MARLPSKKEETKNKLVASASRNFRRHGYGGIGVDGIASSAEVTSGAFYSHLGSKDGAFKAALEQGLDEVVEAMTQIQNDNGGQWTESFAHYYLGEEHVQNLECGCAMASLTLDVARMNDKNAKAFESRFSKIIEQVMLGLSGNDENDKYRRAWSFLSLLVGGLTFLRALHSKTVRKSARDGLVTSAIKVAGRAKKR